MGKLLDKIIAEAKPFDQYLKENRSFKPSNKAIKEQTYALPSPYNRKTTTTESQIKTQTESILKLNNIFFKRIQVQGAFVHKGDTATMMKSTMTGMSDLVICYKGQFVGVELKAPGGRVKSTQLAFLEQLKLAGGRGAILVDPTKLIPWLKKDTLGIDLNGVEVL